LINPPEDYNSILGVLPKNVSILSESEEKVDFLQIFVKNRKELEEFLPKLKEKLKAEGKLWVSYLKGTSKIKTDINRDSLREFAQTIGLKAVGLISINKEWSSMRLKIVE
jgi:predicted CoA-binding protein